MAASRKKKTADLFGPAREANLRKAQPLAARMRPRDLDEFVGQEHFLGPGKLLRRLLQADRLGSVIFYGPPGTGKTALAHVIAHHTHCRFRPLNAVAAGIKEVRERPRRGPHRAGGHRPAHHPVRRRAAPLQPRPAGRAAAGRRGGPRHPDRRDDAEPVLRRQFAAAEPQPDLHVRAAERASRSRRCCGGRWPTRSAAWATIAVHVDARTPSTSWPRSATATPGGRSAPWRSACCRRRRAPVEFTLEVAQESIQRKALDYDATGDAHYDVASAFIKSMRGSDPDAAIYWLARMLEAGEDPRFIARRIVILASEDVGNADPQALVLAAAALQAVEFVGLPECQLHAGPGGDLPGDGARSRTPPRWPSARPARTCAPAARWRCRSTCATATTTGPSSSATARATSTATTTQAAGSDQAYLAGGAALLRADRSRLRGGDSQADGGAAGEIHEGRILAPPRTRRIVALPWSDGMNTNGTPHILVCAEPMEALQELRRVLSQGGRHVDVHVAGAPDPPNLGRYHLLVVDAGRAAAEALDLLPPLPRPPGRRLHAHPVRHRRPRPGRPPRLLRGRRRRLPAPAVRRRGAARPGARPAPHQGCSRPVE